MKRVVLLTLVVLLLTACGAPAAHNAQDVVDAFKAAGLEVEDVKTIPVTKANFGLCPMYAIAAVDFEIPSVCLGPQTIGLSCGASILVFATKDKEGLEKTRDYYDAIGKASAIFFNWVVVHDNILVNMSGDVPEAMVKQYQAALDGMK